MQYISIHVDWKDIKLGVQYNGEITANYVLRKNDNQPESDFEGIQIAKDDQERHRVNAGGLQHVKCKDHSCGPTLGEAGFLIM